MGIFLAKARVCFLWLLVGGIRFYQRCLACLWPSSCRYHPSCSAYFIESLNSYGVIFGSLKGGWRILRCNPFSAGGYDPVNYKEMITPPRSAELIRPATGGAH